MQLQLIFFFLFDKQSLIVPQVFGAVSLCLKQRNPKRAEEERSRVWWEKEYRNWTEKQFKKRLRMNREKFQFILNVITDDITNETTEFKGPIPPECELRNFRSVPRLEREFKTSFPSRQKNRPRKIVCFDGKIRGINSDDFPSKIRLVPVSHEDEFAVSSVKTANHRTTSLIK